ncbi:MAG TPA: thiamine pyrophosphate-dependent dehydrogenase E1 component subunit alpha [Chloroflexota bacterium]|nr:thiamine pyrophosphate-dependent dehydrogenase E1 component subunit alpha [Chloroflexota bacterium]
MTASPDLLLSMYRWMVLCRELESECSRANPRWFPVAGEEAAIVGTFFGARPDDLIAPHYRGPFITYLMRGAELDRLVGQALGKANGYSRGRAVPFSGPVALGIVPWVAGDLGTSLSVATGAALAIRYRQESGRTDDRVVVVSFGDGTANRGDFHEALNLAAVSKLPIVYVCQNNQHAISLHWRTYVAGGSIAARGSGYGVPGLVADGNNPLEVGRTVQGAIDRARRGEGPSIIEALTYRVAGHWAEDTGSYRDQQEVREWSERDPIRRARVELVAQGANDKFLDQIHAAERRRVTDSFARVRELPDAGSTDLGLDEVYA